LINIYTMALNILIDMIKLRNAIVENSAMSLPEAYFYPALNVNGLKTIRELATFRFTCRKCEKAPCIEVCPADALGKDTDGVVERYTNLCVSCKSCVTICPFGTMMTDFFNHHRNRDLLYDLKDENELEKFIKVCPEGSVTMTDSEETPDKHIYRLNEKVLIKDYLYITERQ
jgi:Fe-S-cluster-containing hydrogenase component 2